MTVQTEAEREEAFREDLSDLLNRHGAIITPIPQGTPQEPDATLIVFMPIVWDENQYEEIKEPCSFEW